MLTLYQSSDLKSLAGRLLGELSEDSSSNPLQPDLIILQNNQMKRWLQKFIAREQGIAASLETEFPGEFIWEIYRQMDDNLPETLPCERGPMRFSIFEVLQSRKRYDKLRPLYNYIETDVGGGTAERAWNLGARIADLFDRYQIYRPDMILEWQQGELHTNATDEKWQAALWRILQKKWDDQLEDLKEKNRPELHNAIMEAIQNKTLPVDQLPYEINIFAIAPPAPVFLETFIQLSKVVDVNFYWLDVIHAENNDRSLIESWGKPGSEFLELFKYYVDKAEAECKDVPIRSQNQPSCVKTSVGKQSDGENVIQVHSCHSPMREVEVLYDQLLAIFDEQPELNPSDVLIITPDIETYAPFIYSVFGSHDTGRPEIPYHISNHNLSGAPAVQSFIKLLELLESRFKVTDVLDLLSAAAVREAFNISEDELSRLERWIDDNNIRWGIDASFKAKMELPASDHFTWQAGLNRMMLGATMEPVGHNLLNDIYPYPGVATSDDALLAGKFGHFLDELFTLYKKIQTPKSLDDWAQITQKVVQTFLTDDLEFRDELFVLTQAIEKLRELKKITGVESELPFKIIYLWLRNELEEQIKKSGGSGRGVTFSSMIATRSIPFKIIGMIGMNDDAFPRRETPVGFDLMNLERQPGDSDQLEKDRYLFLEALKLAEEHCYFSYVGQSDREDADFPPSVLITELLDHLQEQYKIKPESIIQKHPLQIFSIDYFKKSELFTYSKNRKKLAEQLLKTQAEGKSWLGASLPVSGDESKTISINDLISYYQHPARFVLKNRVGLFIKNEKILDEDRELFELKGLDKYGVKQDLIDAYLERQSLDGLRAVLSAQDRLPEGWPGRQAFEQKAEEAQTFGDQVLKKTGDHPAEEVEIDIDLAGFKLTGKISGYYSPLLLDYRFGRRRAKDLIAWWIKHVALSAAENTADVNSTLLTWDKGKLKEDYLGVLGKPEDILTELLEGYQQGLQKITYYFPQSSYAFAEKMYKDNSEEDEAINKALKEWAPNEYSPVPSESEDVYVKLITRDENPLEHSAFKEAAHRFWNPFLNVFNKQKK